MAVYPKCPSTWTSFSIHWGSPLALDVVGLGLLDKVIRRRRKLWPLLSIPVSEFFISSVLFHNGWKRENLNLSGYDIGSRTPHPFITCSSSTSSSFCVENRHRRMGRQELCASIQKLPSYKKKRTCEGGALILHFPYAKKNMKHSTSRSSLPDAQYRRGENCETFSLPPPLLLLFECSNDSRGNAEQENKVWDSTQNRKGGSGGRRQRGGFKWRRKRKRMSKKADEEE